MIGKAASAYERLSQGFKSDESHWIQNINSSLFIEIAEYSVLQHFLFLFWISSIPIICFFCGIT